MSQSLTPPKQTWLENPAWDIVWIFNGFFLFALVVLAMILGHPHFLVAKLTIFALAFLWGGHILSPMITVWRIPELRTHARQKYIAFILIPALTMLVCPLLLILVTPFRPEAVNIILILFLFWNSWHFSAQHYGILSIYRYRAGYQDDATRKFDRVYTLICTCLLLPIAWYLHGARLGPLFGIATPPVEINNFRHILMGLCCATIVAFQLIAHKGPRAPWPRRAYYIYVGLQPLCIAYSYSLFSVLLFSIQHWIVALALSSRILTQQDHGKSGTGGYLLNYLGLAILSLPLFFLIWSPALLGNAVNQSHELILHAFRAATTELAQTRALGTFPAMIASLYFGLSFVHFQYDRLLYAFKDPAVREHVAPRLYQPLTQRNAS